MHQHFPLFLVPFESWHKNLQNIQITAWHVSPNSFYGQNRTAKRVYEERNYGFWPIWRSLNQYFPLFLVSFESWHKNLQNIPSIALNVPPNSFYGQNRTAKRVCEKRIYGFGPIWRSVKQYFPLFWSYSWLRNLQTIQISIKDYSYSGGRILVLLSPSPFPSAQNKKWL